MGDAGTDRFPVFFQVFTLSYLLTKFKAGTWQRLRKVVDAEETRGDVIRKTSNKDDHARQCEKD